MFNSCHVYCLYSFISERLLVNMPFIARTIQLQRLQQFVLTPSAYALCFVAADGMGKTRLLNQVGALDEDFIAVNIQLDKPQMRNETVFFSTVIAYTQEALEQRQFNASRLPKIPEDIELHVWLKEVYLSELVRLIRPHRRLIWILDDVEKILEAIQRQDLPTELPQALVDLLKICPQLVILVSAKLENETHILKLSPLIQPQAIERLNRLTDSEVVAFIDSKLENPTAELMAEVQRQTGGVPSLLDRYAAPLQNHVAIDSATQQVYVASKEGFQKLWFRLSRDERIVLTALSSLTYADPLSPVTPNMIETWLLETDFPMDITSVHTHLRSLEYQEIVVSTPAKIKFVAGLFQQWLLENARLEESPASTPATGISRTILISIFVLAVLVIIGLLVLFNVLPNTTITNQIVPTVTLGS
jgi:hypothetical protein